MAQQRKIETTKTTDPSCCRVVSFLSTTRVSTCFKVSTIHEEVAVNSLKTRSLVCILVTACIAAATANVSRADDPNTERGIIIHEDLVYGRIHGAGLLADVAYPKTDDPLPAIISVHGGRWRGGNKRDKSAIVVKQWAEFGFFAMSIDYRLVGCTPAPACYQDMQCAIRYVNAHAKKYHIDPNRIFLLGQSAGGHMVSLAATLGDGPFKRTGGWETATNNFRAVISVAANYELTTLSWGGIWTPTDGAPVKARELASPVNHVKQEMRPLLILHSDNDRSVPIGNALLMVKQLEESGAPHQFVRYGDMGHMGINEEVIRRAREFIEEQSAPKE